MSFVAKYPPLQNPGPCQNPDMHDATAPYPRILTRLRLAGWYARREGLAAVLHRMASAIAPPTSDGVAQPDPTVQLNSTARMPVHGEERLNLKPGEWVEVKSMEEILPTLDGYAKHRGLRFVPEMSDFCGRRFRVLKRVEKICIENTPDVRSIKDTVLLEGGVCLGGGIGCDRACFHFWREVWLRRASAPELADRPQSSN
jgi:hypothetical protein